MQKLVYCLSNCLSRNQNSPLSSYVRFKNTEDNDELVAKHTKGKSLITFVQVAIDALSHKSVGRNIDVRESYNTLIQSWLPLMLFLLYANKYR